MEKEKRIALHEELSARGLMSELFDRMQKQRPTMARSIIYLAFEDGGTTALRRRILLEAERLAEGIAVAA